MKEKSRIDSNLKSANITFSIPNIKNQNTWLEDTSMINEIENLLSGKQNRGSEETNYVKQIFALDRLNVNS